MSLENQVVLITGCSTGIGRALALELAQRRQRVFATARRVESLRDLEHPAIEKLALDVTDGESIATAVAALLQRAGRVDMLINNAGVNVVGPLAEVPLEVMRRLLETNVTGLLALSQAVFPYMADRRSGRIVNIGSVVAQLPTPFAGPYCASKAAVHMLSDVLRMEVAPFGIDVIEVQPGAVRSSIADTASQGMERYQRETSRYRAVYEGIARRARASQERPMETDQFARVVVRALLADKAPRIVRAGNGARVYYALGQLPGATRDHVVTRRFGLLGWKG
jgi:NAD(P)-dependent dehydrogenase (short-subunit alcohol dehydrogenase family)